MAITIVQQQKCLNKTHAKSAQTKKTSSVRQNNILTILAKVILISISVLCGPISDWTVASFWSVNRLMLDGLSAGGTGEALNTVIISVDF